jgi:hypothetical protein
LPAPSTDDVHALPLTVIVSALDGVGANRKAEEAAAASVRVSVRTICMYYLDIAAMKCPARKRKIRSIYSVTPITRRQASPDARLSLTDGFPVQYNSIIFVSPGLRPDVAKKGGTRRSRLFVT